MADAIEGIVAAGADAVVLQPLEGDAGCLDEYIRDVMPLLAARGVVHHI